MWSPLKHGNVVVETRNRARRLHMHLMSVYVAGCHTYSFLYHKICRSRRVLPSNSSKQGDTYIHQTAYTMRQARDLTRVQQPRNRLERYWAILKRAQYLAGFQNPPRYWCLDENRKKRRLIDLLGKILRVSTILQMAQLPIHAWHGPATHTQAVCFTPPQLEDRDVGHARHAPQCHLSVLNPCLP
jgi:hypothetical protein